MDSEELALVNTCGVCEEICSYHVIGTHPCVAHFNNIFIDENRYFYSQCDDGTILRRSEVPGQGEIPVAETIDELSVPHSELNDKINFSSTDIDLEELLISEVQRRPPLYDYTLP